MKNNILTLAFAVLITFSPVFAFAQYYDGGFAGYGGGGDSYLFPSGGGVPQQELYVRSWGPTGSAPSYMQQNAYPTQNYSQQYPQYQHMPQNQYVPQYSSYGAGQYNSGFAPQMASPSYQDFYSKFLNYTVVAPGNYTNVPAAVSYMPSQTNTQRNSYSYPTTQKQYPSYQNYGGGYGYGSSYGQPVAGTDFWGNPMCNWGADYGNFPCDRDPHQWVYDPYTGTTY